MVWTSSSAIHLQINRNDVFAVNRNHAGSQFGPVDYCGGIARIVVDVGGSPFVADGNTFRQRLSLETAECAIEGHKLDVSCFVLGLDYGDALLSSVCRRHDRPDGYLFQYVCATVASSGSELAIQAWWRYRYTGDRQWLRSHAYPMLRGTVEFYRHLIRKEADSHFHLSGTHAHEDFRGVTDSICRSGIEDRRGMPLEKSMGQGVRPQ